VTDTSAPRVEAEFVWDPKEYGRVVQHLTRDKLGSRGWRLAFVLGGGWLTWTLGRIIYSAVATGDLGRGLAAILPWLLFVSFLIWAIRWGGGWMAARRAMKLDPRVDRLHRHVIDHEGIHVDTGSGSMSLPWTGMERVAETEEHFLWYWHAEMALYTPKRALTEAGVDAARDLILLHAADRARLQP
jgi:hypothetical protein